MKTDVASPSNATETTGPTPMVLEELTPDAQARKPAKTSTGLGRVLDVTVPLAARIGVVRKTISEVIDLQPGSVIDLERVASEPVDVVVGEKLIARGEIVVVDDRYGIRITEIIQEGR